MNIVDLKLREETNLSHLFKHAQDTELHFDPKNITRRSTTVKGINVTNDQLPNGPTDETSLPERMSDCRSPVEQALWRALKIARDERDEARREVCRWLATAESGTEQEHATEQGWDCFNVGNSESASPLSTSSWLNAKESKHDRH